MFKVFLIIASLMVVYPSMGLNHVSDNIGEVYAQKKKKKKSCLLYTSPSPRDKRQSRMPSSA